MKPRSAREIWEIALGALQIQVSKANYETWLKNSVGIDYQPDLFVVGVPTAFAAGWLEKRLQSLIQKTLMSIVGHEFTVQFQVCPFPSPRASRARRQAKAGTANGEQLPLRLNPRYTFDSFVKGNSNYLAYTAALGVAENPGCSYNPLFIYGDTGLGKTHLLHAIGHIALEHGFYVLYVSAEQFTHEFVNSIQKRATEEFRQRYRSADMFLVDDIQFIAGKEQTQISFFHTFNDLYNANCQIALTSDRHPRYIPLLEERLRSRFESGLTIDIQPPDLEVRQAILETKVAQMNIEINPDIIRQIAAEDWRSIRELEGALNRVAVLARMTKGSLSSESVSTLLCNTPPLSKQRPPLPPHIIIEAVARYFRLSPEALKSKKRDRETTWARQIAMYLIREEAPCSLTEIGRELGGRDHSTVFHGCSKIAQQFNTNPHLQQQILKLRESLHTEKQ